MRPSLIGDLVWITIGLTIAVFVIGLVGVTVVTMAMIAWTDWHETPETTAHGDLLAGISFLVAALILSVALVGAHLNQRGWKRKQKQEAELERRKKRLSLEQRLQHMGLDPDELRDLLEE